jgi:hypothetical protein
MTDRELLELAAKAAGQTPVLCYESKRNCLRIGGRDRYRLWRPLEDDGDALRLAVKLRLEITWWKQGVRVEPAHGRESVTSFGDVPYAATRRAIVRAAAEIGRNMT